MHALRYHCGVPVIIEGETGVGKTALVEMLSKLWNYALVVQWKRRCGQLLDKMKSKLKDISPDVSDNYHVSHNFCVIFFPKRHLSFPLSFHFSFSPSYLL